MTGSYAIVTVREGFFYAQPGSAGGGNESAKERGSRSAPLSFASG